ncbi:hypothetical protein [Bacillus marinisedimentorum]|uniref:hypothetical protein n=1 Tax=Bacillus marinisedimentorum TaxID=1821260 RepID=UPI0008721519|nr:hypothetical protein [Bacillus marinisedimentorum]
MPKTFSGRLSIVVSALFVAQLIYFIISSVSDNGLGAIVNFIQLAPFMVLFGLIFGATGIIKEMGKRKVIPIITLIISMFFAGFTFFLLYGWSFGG